ncbi:VOC family protein [Acetobacteraceae bacterium KSS8]|uniref:VOC family protein n=1 Tax=Endosaccharibacter trunci TaxID=2812733 RepID=A0ABT1W8S0_9PROT|nr:VOC family protein [Acetobacteraceae bacterium KSS8]
MSPIRFVLRSADPQRLATFYRDALGFSVGDATTGPSRTIPLRLGAQQVEIVAVPPDAAPYPADSTSNDSWFQHLALVATDIGAAHERLAAIPGWTPISTGGGPVLLPPSSGGVRAFKFRDPDGHPLELLEFPPGKIPAAWSRFGRGDGPLVGIDHSALVVSNLAASLDYYGKLGFLVLAESENAGPEQDALDGAVSVAVSVRALSRSDVPPHLELLAYREPPVRRGPIEPDGVADTRTVLDEAGACVRDPDGHAVMVGPGG